MQNVIITISSTNTSNANKFRALFALGLSNQEVLTALGHNNAGEVYNVRTKWVQRGCPNPFAALGMEIPEGALIGEEAVCTSGLPSYVVEQGLDCIANGGTPAPRAHNATRRVAVVSNGENVVSAVTRAVEGTTSNVNALQTAITAMQGLLNAQMAQSAQDIYEGHTIGVEMETIQLGIDESLRLLNKYGIPTSDRTGYHRSNEERMWESKHDGSVHCPNGRGAEITSPVLRGAEGLKELKKVLSILEDTTADANSSCGLHVHIGMDENNIEHMKNVAINYMLCQRAINQFLPASRRRTAEYVDGHDNYSRAMMPTNSWIAGIINAETLAEVVEAVNYNGKRYWAVNEHAIYSHHTIEFRQHSGTTNYRKVMMWVEFLVRLVNWSRDNRMSAEVVNINEIPWMTEELTEYYELRKMQVNG